MDQHEPDRTCRCGCGAPVAPGRQWIRGHAARGAGGYHPAAPGMEPLPGPGDIDWDAGIIDLDGPAAAPGPGGAGAAGPGGPPGQPPGPGPAPGPAGGLPAAPPDEPPAHARRDWHRQDRAAKARPGRPGRITAAVRTDIDAKISFALEIPGRIWQARDPVCGGVFIAQRAEISRSMADIACKSPQLVEWFTGTGGGFLMFLDLGAALWPVITVAMAHHVYHSIGEEQEGQDPAGGPPLQPDYSRFAA